MDVRWALTLCCNYIEVSENVFSGVGRMSALQVPAVSAMMKYYYKPMNDWLTNDFTLSDGYHPWDPDFASKLAAALTQDYGYDLSQYTPDQLIDVFGTGYWKTDLDEATKLLQGAGFTLKDGKWYNADGSPFTINVIVNPEEDSTHASRSGKAIADQWDKFGITTNVQTVATADIGSRVNLGDFEVASTWDDCSAYTVDFYNNINGWDDKAFSYPIGQVATGISSYRLPQSNPQLSSQISDLVEHIATLDPHGTEIQGALTDFLKLATQAHISITVHAGTKIVPINTTYWTGFPTADDPYEGPWWWWSLFRGITTHLKPAA